MSKTYADIFLEDLYLVIQAWDDFVDGDEMPRDEKDRAIYASLVGIPSNPFYRANCDILLPLISNAVLKWKASDTSERANKNLHLSFVWRAAYFDIVLQVMCITHGAEYAMQHAHEVMELYGENFKDYKKEFLDA